MLKRAKVDWAEYSYAERKKEPIVIGYADQCEIDMMNAALESGDYDNMSDKRWCAKLEREYSRNVKVEKAISGIRKAAQSVRQTSDD